MCVYSLLSFDLCPCLHSFLPSLNSTHFGGYILATNRAFASHLPVLSCARISCHLACSHQSHPSNCMFGRTEVYYRSLSFAAHARIMSIWCVIAHVRIQLERHYCNQYPMHTRCTVYYSHSRRMLLSTLSYSYAIIRPNSFQPLCAFCCCAHCSGC